MLPGQPTVNTTTTDGATVPLRQYILERDGGNSVVIFQVIDAPFRQVHFDKNPRAVASFQSNGTVSQSNGTVTDSRPLVLDGHPADGGRIAATIEGTPAVYLVRLVSDNGYLVGIVTLGRATDESALTQLHHQVLGTLHLV